LRVLLGERARDRRRALGLKVKQLAELTGVIPLHLYQMEHCLRNNPDVAFEKAWESALGVPSGWLRDMSMPTPELAGRDGAEGLPRLGNARGFNYLSPDVRTALALRARQRRSDLGLTLADCADAVGAQRSNLANYERILRKFPDMALERAWEKVLQVPEGWLRDTRMETPAHSRDANSNQASPTMTTQEFHSTSTEGCSTVADEIRAVSAWLSRKNVQRRTTNLNFLTASEQIWARCFAERYGVLGASQSSLASIGARAGLTRERIRQFIKSMTERSTDLPISTPLLDSLAAECEKLAPASVASIDDRLAPLLGESLSIESAQRFASEILGKRVVTFASTAYAGAASTPQLVIKTWTDDDDALLKVLRSVSLKMIRGSGAANLYYVCGMASEVLQRHTTLSLVRTMIVLIPDFEWLIEDEGWYWFGDGNGENRLQNVTRKVMAAAGRKVDIDQISQAFVRSFRENYRADDSQSFSIEAPPKILLEVLQRTPWLTRIQYNDFAANDSADLLNVLSDVEVEVISCLKSNGGVAAKHEIDLHVCEALGVSVVATTTALAKSPCFIQPAMGLYAVIGVEIEPSAYHRAFEHSGPQSRRASTSLPDQHGNYTYRFVLSLYHLKHRFIGLPQRLSAHLEVGNYALTGQQLPALITTRDSGLTLFSKMMDRLDMLGAKAGDTLLLSLNPTTRTANLDLVVE
jgi:transcriptional regulator with XRE-family HTH domain